MEQVNFRCFETFNTRLAKGAVFCKLSWSKKIECRVGFISQPALSHVLLYRFLMTGALGMAFTGKHSCRFYLEFEPSHPDHEGVSRDTKNNGDQREVEGHLVQDVRNRHPVALEVKGHRRIGRHSVPMRYKGRQRLSDLDKISSLIFLSSFFLVTFFACMPDGTHPTVVRLRHLFKFVIPSGSETAVGLLARLRSSTVLWKWFLWRKGCSSQRDVVHHTGWHKPTIACPPLARPSCSHKIVHLLHTTDNLQRGL